MINDDIVHIQLNFSPIKATLYVYTYLPFGLSNQMCERFSRHLLPVRGDGVSLPVLRSVPQSLPEYSPSRTASASSPRWSPEYSCGPLIPGRAGPASVTLPAWPVTPTRHAARPPVCHRRGRELNERYCVLAHPVHGTSPGSYHCHVCLCKRRRTLCDCAADRGCRVSR